MVQVDSWPLTNTTMSEDNTQVAEEVVATPEAPAEAPVEAPVEAAPAADETPVA